jgi:hypothetical protein
VSIKIGTGLASGALLVGVVAYYIAIIIFALMLAIRPAG